MNTHTTINFDKLTPKVETPEVFKALIPAHRHLAELKGLAKSIPNEAILLSSLVLQEAQDSSEIENIITTQDDLYKHQLQSDVSSLAAKEVSNYASAISMGFKKTDQQGLLTLNTILEIQAELEGNKAGFRKVPGTVLGNESTGEVIYTPPSPDEIPALLDNLEKMINPEGFSLDPLIKMAIIHHQFETIHPFYDGNGRTGRIINILYLIKEGLLDSPILYLSRYINHSKDDYYRLLKTVRDTGNWQEWVLYILKGIELTAKHSIVLVEKIKALLQHQKHFIRDNHKFYSQDLVNNIFRHPYTKVYFLERDLNVSRATATRYLDALAGSEILSKHKHGRESYYINKELVGLLFNTPRIES